MSKTLNSKVSDLLVGKPMLKKYKDTLKKQELRVKYWKNINDTTTDIEQKELSEKKLKIYEIEIKQTKRYIKKNEKYINYRESINDPMDDSEFDVDFGLYQNGIF